MNRKQRRAQTSPSSKEGALSALQATFAEAFRLHQSGCLTEAETLYRHVLAVDARNDDALHLLGLTVYQLGRNEEAVEIIGRAIKLNGKAAHYHSNLALALKALGRLDEAIGAFTVAISLRPDYAIAYSNLGNALSERGLFEAAITAYAAAIRIEPDYAEAYSNQGNALCDLGRFDDATLAFATAIRVKPDFAEAHSNLGDALYSLGRLDEAAAACDAAIRLKPDLAGAHGHLGMIRLAQGDFAAGWREYEWRMQTPELTRSRRDFPQPLWRGEEGQGRTLLIHAEQGLGDTIQFCRFVPLAAARGWRVVLEVPSALVRLLEGLLEGGQQVMARGETLPEFDAHCPMMSLPLAMDTTLETIPASMPYLRVAPEQQSVWRQRVAAVAGGRPRIGLVWAGSARLHNPRLNAVDRRRSMVPELLEPLYTTEDFAFFSLQKDGPKAPVGAPLIDMMDEMGDFADTAALVANLDLVISVDTALVHLAAALGKPVWLLDRFDPCWRWLRDREDSPWYPTLRLFRQSKPNDWPGVVARVCAELRGHPVKTLS